MELTQTLPRKRKFYTLIKKNQFVATPYYKEFLGFMFNEKKNEGME